MNKVKPNRVKPVTARGNKCQVLVGHGETITECKQAKLIAMLIAVIGYASFPNSFIPELLGAKQPNSSADSRSSPAVGA
jgi:hypothetical protein